LEKALASLKALAEHKARTGSAITIGAQCVLVPENKDSVVSLARRLRELGADYFSIKHFYPHSDNMYRPDMSFLTADFVADLKGMAAELSDETFQWVVRDVERLNRERPYRECQGLPFIVYVREDGMLYTCFSHQDDPEAVVGNVLDTDFSTLWRTDRPERAMRHINIRYDKGLCQANCRHHEINLWLWRLKSPPAHVNFI
jgi:radical SAM protein with 4Fe4S-binding SPASM domain